MANATQQYATKSMSFYERQASLIFDHIEQITPPIKRKIPAALWSTFPPAYQELCNLESSMWWATGFVSATRAAELLAFIPLNQRKPKEARFRYAEDQKNSRFGVSGLLVNFNEKGEPEIDDGQNRLIAQTISGGWARYNIMFDVPPHVVRQEDRAVPRSLPDVINLAHAKNLKGRIDETDIMAIRIFLQLSKIRGSRNDERATEAELVEFLMEPVNLSLVRTSRQFIRYTGTKYSPLMAVLMRMISLNKQEHLPLIRKFFEDYENDRTHPAHEPMYRKLRKYYRELIYPTRRPGAERLPTYTGYDALASNYLLADKLWYSYSKNKKRLLNHSVSKENHFEVFFPRRPCDDTEGKTKIVHVLHPESGCTL